MKIGTIRHVNQTISGKEDFVVSMFWLIDRQLENAFCCRFSKAVSFPNYKMFSQFSVIQQVNVISYKYPPGYILYLHKTKTSLFSESFSLKKGSGMCAVGCGVGEGGRGEKG